MEAVVRPPNPVDEGPALLVEWRERTGLRRPAWIASLLLHLAGISALLLVPRGMSQPPVRVAQLRTTPLIAPPDTLTQTAPNRGKIGKEFTLENLVPRRALRLPAGLPSITRPTAPRKPKAAAPAPLPEPPRIDAAGPVPAQAPPPGTATIGAPPPQIQPEEKPKLAFENPGAPQPVRKPTGLSPGQIAAPSTSVTEATRGAIRSGAGGMVVGDIDLPGSGGVGPGLNLPPVSGKTATALELLSNPMGVDFRPYLIRILAAVKRNWLAIIPESARLGRQGKVQVQFAIARDGYVPKLVIAMPSGTDALDRAAVAGISASTPFPPLPTEFQGTQVRLQFTFAYNMK